MLTNQTTSLWKKNLLLLLLVAGLTIFPLLTVKNAEFGGADGQAEEMIGKIDKNYQPWASALWEPPSGEIEGLLFALQAALGAGFIGYYIGFNQGKSKREK